MRGGENVNPLFVGIDVSRRNNVAYLMNPDGSKHSSFSVQKMCIRDRGRLGGRGRGSAAGGKREQHRCV